MRKDTSGPASRMTKREYFIAHAPSEPARWFRPEIPPKPEIGSHMVESEIEEVNEQWRRERERQLTIQWPIAWADLMLEAACQ